MFSNLFKTNALNRVFSNVVLLLAFLAFYGMQDDGFQEMFSTAINFAFFSISIVIFSPYIVEMVSPQVSTIMDDLSGGIDQRISRVENVVDGLCQQLEIIDGKVEAKRVALSKFLLVVVCSL